MCYRLSDGRCPLPWCRTPASISRWYGRPTSARRSRRFRCRRDRPTGR